MDSDALHLGSVSVGEVILADSFGSGYTTASNQIKVDCCLTQFVDSHVAIVDDLGFGQATFHTFVQCFWNGREDRGRNLL